MLSMPFIIQPQSPVMKQCSGLICPSRKQQEGHTYQLVALLSSMSTGWSIFSAIAAVITL